MIRQAALLSLAALATATAADTELRLGPAELILGTELANVQVEHSATRVDDAVLRPYVQGRFWNIGIDAEVWLALGDDQDADIDTGELTEAAFRVDYLFEFPEIFQLLPFYQNHTYVELDPDGEVEDAHWLGLDFWYLSPFEGLEFGGTLAFDAGDEYGWYSAVGARQFYQNRPLDLATWQMLSFGDHDYHGWTSGADEAGLTSFELGAEATLPMPWQDTWAGVRAEVHVWLQDDDRDALEESVEFVISLAFEYRMP